MNDRIMMNVFLSEKNISWSLLTMFFIFDNIFSYYAITRLQGREGNFLIAPFVEKYPLLYFFCIPTTLLIMYAIYRLLRTVAIKFSKLVKLENKNLLERIILGALVIYWAVGNSSMNVAFLFGHRQSARTWALTSLTGVLLASSYSFLMIRKLRGQRE